MRNIPLAASKRVRNVAIRSSRMSIRKRAFGR
jgi:hypothetical protein